MAWFPIRGGTITSGVNASVGGNVLVEGTGGTMGDNNPGVIVHEAETSSLGGLITSGGNGSVTVTGTGGSGLSPRCLCIPARSDHLGRRRRCRGHRHGRRHVRSWHLRDRR